MAKRTKRERREENYQTAFKFGVALVVMLALVGIANLVLYLQGG